MTQPDGGEQQWQKVSNVTDDDVTWLVVTNLTGHDIVVAECEFEQFADMILADHKAAAAAGLLLSLLLELREYAASMEGFCVVHHWEPNAELGQRLDAAIAAAEEAGVIA